MPAVSSLSWAVKAQGRTDSTGWGPQRVGGRPVGVQESGAKQATSARFLRARERIKWASWAPGPLSREGEALCVLAR